MRGNDLKIFIFIMIISLLAGLKLFDRDCDNYSDLITFLSIMIGFKITSLSILFNSPLKKSLYDRKILRYMTELHRLRDYYRFSLIFEVLSIFAIFVIPDNIFLVQLKNITIPVGKYNLVLPILVGTIFCFLKVANDLLKVFVHPVNDVNDNWDSKSKNVK